MHYHRARRHLHTASPLPTLAAGAVPMAMPKCPGIRRLLPFTPVAATCCPTLIFGHLPFGMMTLVQYDAREASIERAASDLELQHLQHRENWRLG